MNQIKGFKFEQLESYDISRIAIVLTKGHKQTHRIMLIENYPDSWLYTIVRGEHCICYNFQDEDAAWNTAISYEQCELFDLATSWQKYGTNIERAFALMVLDYIREQII